MDCFAEFVAPWQWGPAVTGFGSFLGGKQDFNNLSTHQKTKKKRRSTNDRRFWAGEL